MGIKKESGAKEYVSASVSSNVVNFVTNNYIFDKTNFIYCLVDSIFLFKTSPVNNLGALANDLK